MKTRVNNIRVNNIKGKTDEEINELQSWLEEATPATYKTEWQHWVVFKDEKDDKKDGMIFKSDKYTKELKADVGSKE